MNRSRPIPGRLWIIQLAEELSWRVERRVCSWPVSQKASLGDQWVRSTDSIGENISEGYARMHVKERLHFLSIANGSLEEALFQLRRARERQLLPEFEAKVLSGLFIRLSKGIWAFAAQQSGGLP
jgi:four helix bundle protein